MPKSAGRRSALERASSASPSSAKLPAGTVYLSAGQVRASYGNMSEMTLWRWLDDEELGFPRPRWVYNRRYWDLGKLIVWEKKKMCDAPADPYEDRRPPRPRASTSSAARPS